MAVTKSEKNQKNPISSESFEYLYEGKDVDEAIQSGLKKLNLTADDVTMQIVRFGGFFRKAQVLVVPKRLPSRSDKNDGAKRKEFAERAEKTAKFKPEEKLARRPEEKLPPKPAQEPAPVKPKQEEKPVSAKPIPEQRKLEPPVERKPHQPAVPQKPNQPKNNQPNNQPAAQKPAPVKPIKEKEVKEPRPSVQNPQAEDRGEEHSRPRTCVTEEVASEAKAFLEGLLKRMDISAPVTGEIKDGELFINIDTDNGALIGYRGETLDSIEYLTSLAVNKSDDKFYRISVDCNRYREKRADALIATAQKKAAIAVKTGKKMSFEPMNSAARKIIHAALSGNDAIITKSEGKEPNRHIVIIPKRQK